MSPISFPAHTAESLNAIQLKRLIVASGGLWPRAMIAKTVECYIGTLKIWCRDKGAPKPVIAAPIYFYAGNDWVEWFERTERYGRAQKLADAIARYKPLIAYKDIIHID
jgi:hypothetical protein